MTKSLSLIFQLFLAGAFLANPLLANSKLDCLQATLNQKLTPPRPAQLALGTEKSPLPSGWKIDLKNLSEFDFRQIKQLDSIGTSWKTEKINESRLPLPIAVLENKTMFSVQKPFKGLPKAGPKGLPTPFSASTGVNVRDLALKLSGQKLSIPEELSQFEELIQKVIAFDKSANANHDNYNIYISISQGEIEAGKGQRRLGAHTDGFQELDVTYNKGKIIDHTYIVSDAVPTEFFDQAFPVGNRSGREALKFFDDTLDEKNIVKMNPYTVTIMDAFTVHRVAVSQQKTSRTFVKITFSPEKFNREGNTLNPGLDYSGWKWAARKAERNSTSADVIE